MENLIVSLVLILVIGQSIYRVYSNKRKGIKCGGCPASSSCGDKNPCSK